MSIIQCPSTFTLQSESISCIQYIGLHECCNYLCLHSGAGEHEILTCWLYKALTSRNIPQTDLLIDFDALVEDIVFLKALLYETWALWYSGRGLCRLSLITRFCQKSIWIFANPAWSPKEQIRKPKYLRLETSSRINPANCEFDIKETKQFKYHQQPH